jgi:hypothetical protein
LTVDDRDNALAQQRMVINTEDSDWVRHDFPTLPGSRDICTRGASAGKCTGGDFEVKCELRWEVPDSNQLS